MAGTGATPWDARVFAPLFSSFTRRGDLARILRPRGIGIELGVADGDFSAQLLESSALRFLYSVDIYDGDRGHDVNQYRNALRKLLKHRSRSSLLRMRFDEAVDLFEDEYFDLIYVDGYAHTGEEGGKTFDQWFPKVRKGGVFAGHDYAPEWSAVVAAVDRFIGERNLPFFLIHDPTGGWNFASPTWFTIRSD
jgi:hypothetical protein